MLHATCMPERYVVIHALSFQASFVMKALWESGLWHASGFPKGSPEETTKTAGSGAEAIGQSEFGWCRIHAAAVCATQAHIHQKIISPGGGLDLTI